METQCCYNCGSHDCICVCDWCLQPYCSKCCEVVSDIVGGHHLICCCCRPGASLQSRNKPVAQDKIADIKYTCHICKCDNAYAVRCDVCKLLCCYECLSYSETITAEGNSLIKALCDNCRLIKAV
jgi:hypothetical protein